MNSAKRLGRMTGLLLIAQLAGLIVPFVMLKALYAPPDFLRSAAQGADVIHCSLLLLVANGAVTTGIAIYLHPVLRSSGRGLASWLIVLGALMLALQAVDNSHVQGMVALSQQYAAAAGTAREALEQFAPVVAAARRNAHYTVLLTIGAWMLVFYAALWRARLVPWGFAAFGVLAAALHLAGVSLPVLAGAHSVMVLAPVLAASHGALILWLLARGFAERSAT